GRRRSTASTPPWRPRPASTGRLTWAPPAPASCPAAPSTPPGLPSSWAGARGPTSPTAPPGSSTGSSSGAEPRAAVAGGRGRLGAMPAAVPARVSERVIDDRRRLGIDALDECWAGEWHLVNPPKSWHGRLLVDLLYVLIPHARARGLEPYGDTTGLFAAPD